MDREGDDPFLHLQLVYESEGDDVAREAGELHLLQSFENGFLRGHYFFSPSLNRSKLARMIGIASSEEETTFTTSRSCGLTSPRATIDSPIHSIRPFHIVPTRITGCSFMCFT